MMRVTAQMKRGGKKTDDLWGLKVDGGLVETGSSHRVC